MKNLLAFLLFCFLFQSTLQAQQSKLSWGVLLAPEFTFMEITEQNATNISTSIGQEGRMEVGFALGGYVKKSFSNPLFVRLGATVEQSRYRYTTGGYRFASDFNPTTGETTTSAFQNKPTILSLNLPLEIGFQKDIKEGSGRFVLGAGIIPNLTLSEKSEGIWQYGNGEKGKTTPSNEINPAKYSIAVFTGYYKRTKRANMLGIEPYLKFSNNTFVFESSGSKAKSTVETGFAVRLEF